MMTSSVEVLWTNALQKLEDKLGKVVFQTWFAITEVEAFDGQNLAIRVPSELALDHITKYYADTLQKIMVDIAKGPIDIQFVLPRADSSKALSSMRQPSGFDHQDFTSSMAFNAKYTFETFVIGDRNKLAHAASIAIAEKPAASYNPFFLYGGVGLGKTHLMHAIGQRAIEINPSARVVYITSETFVREYVTALQSNAVPDFRNKYRTVDILLIDDIQFIAGKDSTQEEFFHTFNTLHSDHKQIVITSDRSPKDIPDLEDRLRSRFSGGLIIDIKPPEFETRIAILRKKAKAEGIEIPDNAIHMIASKIETNVRELEGALIRVIAYSSMMARDIDTSLTLEALSDLVNNPTKKPTTVSDIQRTVASHYHLRIEDLRGRSRQKDIVFPRQIAMYLARQMTGLSLPKIGEEFGKRDHTTVLHACDKVEQEIKTDHFLKQTIDHLKETISTI